MSSHPLAPSGPRRPLCRALLAAFGLAVLASPLAAREAPAATRQLHRYDIPAGPLAQALDRFAAQGGAVVERDLPLDGKRSHGLHGDYAAQDALAALLAGSGVKALDRGGGRYRLVARAPGEPEGVTTLEGVQATADVVQDDGYTVRAARGATRLPLSPRETPQSVSVVTRQQMDDFGLDNINAVLDATTGVNVERVETDRTFYSARGFDVTNFLVDGLGLPFTNGEQEGDIDTALYERVEVLRGANGLLSFTGNPSATINFVRKRPTADVQGNVGVGVGSWDDRRLDIDLSGPLNASHSVRGRLVAADQDTDSYLDRYHLRKQVLSGIVEADLSNSTLLSAGVSYQDNQPRGGMWGALPLYYADGSPTDYARSTNPAARWTTWDGADTRAFVELTQDLGADWSLKATFNYRRFAEGGNLFYVYGTPDPATGLGLFSYPSRYTSVEKQYVGDLYASGPFELGGRRHELVLGANAAKSDADQRSLYGNDVGTPLPSLDDWNGDYPRPAFDASRQGAQLHLRRSSLYATARWNLADPLRLITGASLVRVRGSGENYGTPNDYRRTRAVPFVGAVYDLSRNYSLYASYAQLFNPQTQTDVNNKVLDPVIGANLEAGVKGEWYEGRLNASFALFRTRQDGLAEYAGHSLETNLDYYRGIDAVARGYEFDVGGQLTEHWQLSGGYTQLGLVDPDGHNVRTYVPRRTFRLATSYRFPAAGVKLGATLRWQDAIRRDQGAVATDGSEIVTRQGGYAVLGLMAGYDFAPGWSATLNLDNVTDRKYLTSLYWGQAYYAAPRSWMLDVRYSF